MAVRHLYEFWATDKNGVKHHEYFKYSSLRLSKVKKHVTKTYNINIEECIDFNIVRSSDI